MDRVVESTLRQQSSDRTLIILGVLWLLLAAAILISQFSRPVAIHYTWVTETEVNTAGFNVYRADSVSGPFAKINEGLIPSKGSAVSGASYTFVDDDVEPGTRYYYMLEDVELDNSSQQHDDDIRSEEAPPLLPWWVLTATTFSLLAGLILLMKGLKAEKVK